MTQYIFKDYVYRDPYSPYYDDYKDQIFVIDHFHEEDPSNTHVWLKCVSNPALIVKGYVHMYDLEAVNEVPN